MSEKASQLVDWVGNEIDILCNVDVNCQKTNQFISEAARKRAGASMTGADGQTSQEGPEQG